MNPFERHIAENLLGPPQPVPEWIKRAKRNRRRKVLRYAKRHNVTPEFAEELIERQIEEDMQGDPND